MKRLYLIGGPMGVGKTAVCRELQKRLDRSVFLDGDWCWDAHPFQVTEETKAMVLDNICYLLSGFLRCSAYRNIIFCWVMHEQGIIDEILSRLDIRTCEVRTVSLVCAREALAERLRRDIGAGLRGEDCLERSAGRLALYRRLKTVKIDVSGLSVEETAERIAAV